MTVGERYQKTWQAAWDRENPEAAGISFTDGAHRCMDAAIPGLWDAEVLEGKVHHPCSNDTAGFYPSDGSESSDLAGLIDPS